MSTILNFPKFLKESYKLKRFGKIVVQHELKNSAYCVSIYIKGVQKGRMKIGTFTSSNRKAARIRAFSRARECLVNQASVWGNREYIDKYFHKRITEHNLFIQKVRDGKKDYDQQHILSNADKVYMGIHQSHAQYIDSLL